MPPQKPMEALKSLRQMAMLNRLSPSLPTSRRLPTPTSCLNSGQVEMNDLHLPSPDPALDVKISEVLKPIREPTSRHQLTVFDRLATAHSQYHPIFPPDSDISYTIISDIMLSSDESETPAPSALVVGPSSSISHILSAIQVPNNLTPMNKLAQYHGSKFCPISSICTVDSCSSGTTVVSSNSATPLDRPFLSQMIRDLHRSSLFQQALRNATGSFCHSL